MKNNDFDKELEDLIKEKRNEIIENLKLIFSALLKISHAIQTMEYLEKITNKKPL